MKLPEHPTLLRRMRDARVKHIQESVEGGTYNVDGKKVADAMIRNVLTDFVL